MKERLIALIDCYLDGDITIDDFLAETEALKKEIEVEEDFDLLQEFISEYRDEPEIVYQVMRD